AAESEQRRHHQQHAVVAEGDPEHALQHAQHDAEQHHNGEVGGEEQSDPLEHVVDPVAPDARLPMKNVPGSKRIQGDGFAKWVQPYSQLHHYPHPPPATAAALPPRPRVTCTPARCWPRLAAGCWRARPTANGGYGSRTWTAQGKSPEPPTSSSRRWPRSASSRMPRWYARAGVK